MSPRMAWRAITSVLPKDAIISSDIGNNCAIGNAYPTLRKAENILRQACLGLVVGFQQSVVQNSTA